MAKHDLKKLALLGLASGLIIANPVSARLIASPTAGDNWNASQDQSQLNQRQNNGAGPRTTSGLRNDSGARGPGGVRQPTSQRDNNYSDETQSEMQGAQNQRNNQSQLALENNGKTNSNTRTNSNGRNNSNHKSNSELAVGDYDTLTNDAMTPKKGTDNAIKPSNTSTNQGVKNTPFSNPRTTNQGGKTNTPANPNVPNKKGATNQPTSPSEYAYSGERSSSNIAMNDYVSGGSCGSSDYEPQDNEQYYQEYQSEGYAQPLRFHGRKAQHNCGGSGSCGSQSYEKSAGNIQNRTQKQNRQNNAGRQQAGLSDQTQLQPRQRPGPSGNQGVSAQRNNSSRQQPQYHPQGY